MMCWAGRFSVFVLIAVVAARLSAAPSVAQSSDSFVDSIGVNIHATHYLGFSTTAYDDWNSVVSAMGSLGIRNVRDHIFDVGRLNQITADTGAKVTAIMDQHTVPPGGSYLTLDQSKLPSLINLAKSLTGLAALEGPSEYDQSSDPNWQANLRSFQIALYNAAKGDPALAALPLLAPAVTDGSTYAGFSDLAAYADRGNVHYYPPNTVPVGNLNYWLNTSAQMVGAKSAWVTETGYVNGPVHTNPYDVSETAAGKYMPRLLMDNYAAGVQKTFLYELVDDNLDPSDSNAENHFGLLHNDFSMKASGTALKNLIALLKDPGSPFTPASLDYTLTGGNATLRHVLFQKRDGTFWLALWQDLSVFDKPTNSDITNPDLPVTLTLGSSVASAATYLPDGSMNPVSIYGAVSQLNLNVPDQVMLVQLTPVPEPTGALMLAGVLLMIGRRRSRQATAARRQNVILRHSEKSGTSA